MALLSSLLMKGYRDATHTLWHGCRMHTTQVPVLLILCSMRYTCSCYSPHASVCVRLSRFRAMEVEKLRGAAARAEVTIDVYPDRASLTQHRLQRHTRNTPRHALIHYKPPNTDWGFNSGSVMG